MWIYEKKLQYPVRVTEKNVGLAKIILTQYGGPNGEFSASTQYLTQRFAMPLNVTRGLLTDIGTEELAHMEIVATLFKKLIDGATKEELEEAGMSGYFSNHELCPFYIDPSGIPWEAKYISANGDPITDLTSNMAAEQRARITYENLITLSDDPLVRDVLRFLREREVVHFQRFGEGLRIVQEDINSKKVF